jgi:hypothetical protein
MVDMIVRTTALVVVMLATLNAMHAGTIFVRLVQRLARRRGGVALLLPTFRSVADVLDWLEDWRVFWNGGDRALVALRHDARIVIGRYLHLTIVSNAWIFALLLIAPGSA